MEMPVKTPRCPYCHSPVEDASDLLVVGFTGQDGDPRYSIAHQTCDDTAEDDAKKHLRRDRRVVQ